MKSQLSPIQHEIKTFLMPPQIRCRDGDSMPILKRRALHYIQQEASQLDQDKKTQAVQYAQILGGRKYTTHDSMRSNYRFKLVTKNGVKEVRKCPVVKRERFTVSKEDVQQVINILTCEL